MHQYHGHQSTSHVLQALGSVLSNQSLHNLVQATHDIGPQTGQRPVAAEDHVFIPACRVHVKGVNVCGLLKSNVKSRSDPWTPFLIFAASCANTACTCSSRLSVLCGQRNAIFQILDRSTKLSRALPSCSQKVPQSLREHGKFILFRFDVSD